MKCGAVDDTALATETQKGNVTNGAEQGPDTAHTEIVRRRIYKHCRTLLQHRKGKEGKKDI